MKALLRYRFLMAKPSCIPASQFQIDRRVNNLGLGNGRTHLTPRSDPRHRLLMLVMVNVDVGVTTRYFTPPPGRQKNRLMNILGLALVPSLLRLSAAARPGTFSRVTPALSAPRRRHKPGIQISEISRSCGVWHNTVHHLLPVQGDKIMTLSHYSDTCAISFI